MIAIGLMSGTSLDGISAAVVRVAPRGDGYDLELLRFHTFPYGEDLGRALRAVLPPNDGSVGMVAALHQGLGRAYADAAAGIAAAAGERIDYVASHGQTIWHDGPRHVTLQVGDAFAIRQAIGASVCYDFRSADCAAGGQGAPLIPYVDALLLADAREDRVALNLGGIANLTLLRRGATHDDLIAFDTGPGNMLVDAFVRERTHGRASYDAGGSLAAAGTVDEEMLSAMLADDYFAQSPPKTTGRERFGAHFLTRYQERLGRMSVEDGASTLTELTAASVADAIVASGFDGARVIASGGGARNATMLARIAARLPEARVELSDTMGIPVDAKEAMGFAVLGYETLRGRAANVPSATGAQRAMPLGAIAPWKLDELLNGIRRECQTSASP
ncbi:MAG: anhydro-N-acetylmuramic acid kinase [Candidatus Eremiobacteraeota bacterium]|nr:anhydro-N-acetylmuramic acid kinase [Candidatus Eremiobacteraeota bacterium]